MGIWNTVFLLGFCVLQCFAREPFKPKLGSMPYLVYFASRYRGICTGVLVSRSVVMTAAVCVANPIPGADDKRPLNVILGSPYRHPRRGIRVQVSKILMPFLGDTHDRVYLIQKSVALLLLKRKVPDILAEVPTRAIDIDWEGNYPLALQEECIIAGWHFFYKGDKIFPVQKFHLQRNLRVQFMNVAKQNMWCEALVLKFRKGLSNLGFHGDLDAGEVVCVRDPDRKAQPCHGMYGAPLICRGQVVGVLTAPDAQWTNCTGFSSLIHLVSNPNLRPFMHCVKGLFDTDWKIEWNVMKDSFYEEYAGAEYDYVPALYDKVLSGENTDSEEFRDPI